MSVFAIFVDDDKLNQDLVDEDELDTDFFVLIRHEQSLEMPLQAPHRTSFDVVFKSFANVLAEMFISATVSVKFDAFILLSFSS